VLVLALVSPLNTLADGYLFSAHMLQHVLLLLIVPPLALLSVPPLQRAPDRWHVPPLVGWFGGWAAMWLWHVPALCDAAGRSALVRGVQVVSLLLSGVLFWWPIIGPVQRQRLRPLAGVVYLFSACLGCTVLGILLAFAPLGVCPVYAHPVDRLGILPLIRDDWGLTPLQDQQLGGLMMWLPPCAVYLSSMLGLLARWYRGTEVAG
jgi:putative membrane protein